MEGLSTDQEQDEIIIKCSLEEMTKAFFKDYEIIWHDPNVNSEENQQCMIQLEKLCKVKAFIEWKQAEDYIKTAKTICQVITSGTNGEFLVKEIFSSQNIPRIFTFCRDEEDHSPYPKNYEKILCSETKIEDVIDQIQKNLLKWYKQTSSLRLDLPVFAPIFNDWDKSQMNHLHLYLKMIPDFHNRVQAKNDFISLSKGIYPDEANKKFIADFEQTYNDYNKEAVLNWYTQQSFLYKVVNNCLRIATSDSIQWSRFLLKDIERAIKDEYKAKSKNFSGLLYRGAYLSETEWSSLKANMNKEIEMHGFLSVSKEKKIALNFVKSDPTQKVFITIIVLKGPNEEDQGFAEVEEFSCFPVEKEILFNVRSRFTVLEAEDEYSKDLPYRHLVLLYGAQSLRKYIAEENPVQQFSIEDIGNILCSHCKISTYEMAEKWFFMSIVDPEKQIYFCKNCLKDNAAPFLCIPATEKVYLANIKGCLLMDPNQVQTPFSGYKCSKCRAKNQKRYFVCTDCSKKRWCENCFGDTLSCMENKHAILLETSPFSFWCEKMSENELNHLRFQNDLETNNNHPFQQARMYVSTHEYEKAIEFYNRSLVECRRNKFFSFYHGLGEVYFHQGEYTKALKFQLKALEMKKSTYGEKHPEIAASFGIIGSTYHERGEYKKALEYQLKSLYIYKSVHGENHFTVASSYNNIGLIYDKQGDSMKALEYHLKTLGIMKSLYGENHPLVAGSGHNIGLMYEKQGQHIKALDYYLKSLDLRKSIYGENHPDVAASYSSLGRIYRKQEEYMKALEYLLKSLDIYKSVDGEKHPDVAGSYHNIGLTYYSQGEYTQALKYYLKSLDIKKSAFGENHPDIADSYHNIGFLYNKQGEHMKALEYRLKSLDIRRSVYGENHPDVASSYHTVGLTYIEQEEHMKALKYFLKCLDIRKCVGENHEDVAASYYNIGLIYDKQGEHVKAHEYHFKSLNALRSLYGENHPLVANSYQNIALIYRKQGEQMKAIEYQLKSLDVYKSIHGENHPNVAGSYHNLGLTFDEQGEQMKALEYLLKSLDLRKSIHGENHPDVAVSCCNIGLIYDKQGDYMKALEYHLKSLDIRKSAFGENHHDVADSYHTIGLINDKQGEHMKALEYLFKSLDIFKLIYGENHLTGAASYNNIGSIYDKQGDYMKALEYYLKALDIIQSLYGKNHPFVVGFYYNIGWAYEKQGEHMKALEYHLKSLDIYKSVHGENHPVVASSYRKIGSIFENKGEHEKSLEFYLKSLNINKSVLGENDPQTIELDKKISKIAAMSPNKK